MIGVYDYTVILTYISLLSAGTGIVSSLSGGGHPYVGTFFLLICGLCDSFDGKVARTKKDRSRLEMNFGIQIESLCDIVSFGVLPACMGVATLRRSPMLKELFGVFNENWFDIFVGKWYCVVGRFSLFAILILYILAAMIRLAYFNVTEEERQEKEGGTRVYYTGLPVTSAALVFPTFLIIQRLVPVDISILYFVVTVLMGFAFISKIKVKKPGLKGILIMIAIGAVEFIIFVLIKNFWPAIHR